MGEKLDTWGKWKREAIRDYDRASSEYLHNKSFFEKYSDELRRAKIMSKLPWYKRWAIKAQAWQSKINRHGMAILSEMGGSAAQLAPDSWKGVAFDLGTLGVGSAAKILKIGKIGKIAGGLSPIKKGTFDALQSLHKAAGYTEIADRAAKVQRARHIYRGAHIVDEAVDVVHSTHLLKAATKTALVGVEKSRPIHQTKFTPQTPFSQQPVVNPLRQMSQGLMKPVVRQPGFDINKLKQPSLSKQAQQEIMRKGIYVPGVWGTEVGRSRPGFDINKLKQPPISKPLEKEIMRKGVYVPGVWGMEINRSRPVLNPLRQMSQGLMNQNRARPMFR